jgi:hypothetical protein
MRNQWNLAGKTGLSPWSVIAAGLAAATSSGCLDYAMEDHPTEDVGSAEAAVEDLQIRQSCPVANCVYLDQRLRYRATFSVDNPRPTDPPSIVYWSLPDGADVIAGCGENSSSCTVDLAPPICGNRLGPDIIVGAARHRLRPFGVLSVGLARVIIPPEGCAQVTCTAPPSVVPALSVHSEFCGGLHTRFIQPVAGATHYQVQAKPTLDAYFGISWSTPWDAIPTSLSYPGIVVDSTSTVCPADANADYRMRARACNECGCTAWGQDALFSFFRGECR